MRKLIPSLLLSAAVAFTCAAPAFAQSSGAKKAVSSTDKKFVKDAAEQQVEVLHLTELTSRPESPGAEPVKEITKKLGADLTTAWGELGTLAQAKGAELPDTKKAGGEKRIIDTLKKAKPEEFDKLFLKTLAKESKKLNSTVEGGTKSLNDAELKGWAEKWSPKFKEHYTAIDKAEEEESKKKK